MQGLQTSYSTGVSHSPLSSPWTVFHIYDSVCPQVFCILAHRKFCLRFLWRVHSDHLKIKKKSSHFLFVGLWVNGKKQINNSDSTISPPPIVPLTWGIARHSLELQWWEPLGLLSSPSGVRLSDQHNKLRGGGRGRLWIIGLNLVRSGLLWSGAVLGKLQVCG